MEGRRGSRVVSTRIPEDIYLTIKNYNPNVSEFVREAVIEKVNRLNLYRNEEYLEAYALLEELIQDHERLKMLEGTLITTTATLLDKLKKLKTLMEP